MGSAPVSPTCSSTEMSVVSEDAEVVPAAQLSPASAWPARFGQHRGRHTVTASPRGMQPGQQRRAFELHKNTFQRCGGQDQLEGTKALWELGGVDTSAICSF